MTKMSMAKRYLRAAGITQISSTVRIDALSVGYKWVNNHLSKVGIRTCHTLLPEERHVDKHSKRTRYEYFQDQIVQYAMTREFQKELDSVNLEKSRTELIK